ncbi:HpnL family protein [Acetobacteraceae bacterium]|nr:HpnL family protein [Acetobacteraceae bacterium]
MFLKKYLPLLFFVAGSICFLYLAINHDINAIFHSLLRVGFVGFSSLLLLSLLNYPILALAWKRTTPELGFFQLLCSRIIRDSAAACLPFSQVGGILIGTYATITFFSKKQSRFLSKNEKRNIATASNLIDITIEAMAQVIFILTALFLLCVTHRSEDTYFKTVGASALILAISLLLFAWLQSHFGHLSRFLIPKIRNQKWKRFFKQKLLRLGIQFSKIWDKPFQIIQGLFFHYLAWIFSASLTWVALFLLSSHISWLNCLILEGISCAIISTFFFVPTSIGVQEGAYISLGLLFGIPAEISFSLSLLRRGREIFVGVPALLWWEGHEIIKNSRGK